MTEKNHQNSGVFSQDDPFSQIRRAILYASGLTYKEITRPFVAVVNTYNEIHPGHRHLHIISDRVKAGIRSGGGVPLEFGTIALCDGLAMGHEGMKYVLPSRQVIADSIELGLRGHRYDAAVLIGSCDKIIPALLMAAIRVDIPTVIVTGGSMLPGYWPRRKQKMSAHTMPKFTRDIISKSDGVSRELREEALSSLYPCPGACWGMGTANTMACLSEVLGMSLPLDATVPAVMSDKLRLAEMAGEKVMELLGSGVTPRQIINRKSLENALKVNAAIGGSLNTVLHLPALAHEIGFKLPLEEFDRCARETPYLANIEPAGPHHVIDLHYAGGIPAVMKILESRLDTSLITVTNHTVAENISGAEVFNPEIIRPLESPVYPYGNIAVLKGNLAEQGAVIKQTALKRELWKFSGPARVFNSEEEATSGLQEGKVQSGDVIVIRYEGPKGGPGMREMALFRAVLKLMGLGDSTYIVTDGRFSGYSEGPCIGYLSPEAAEGGNIALVKDGDRIEIDLENRFLNVNLSEAELQKRREAFTVHPVKDRHQGYLDLYARHVTPAVDGSVFKF